MQIKTIKIGKSGVELTAYIQDIFPSDPSTARRPAVLVFPGGGYEFCSEREAEPIAMADAALSSIGVDLFEQRKRALAAAAKGRVRGDRVYPQKCRGVSYRPQARGRRRLFGRRTFGGQHRRTLENARLHRGERADALPSRCDRFGLSGHYGRRICVGRDAAEPRQRGRPECRQFGNASKRRHAAGVYLPYGRGHVRAGDEQPAIRKRTG